MFHTFSRISIFFFFFFNDTATTEIYTLSLHDALPISVALHQQLRDGGGGCARVLALDPSRARRLGGGGLRRRSEEHTSELQSRLHLVCRLLLEKKKKKTISTVLRWRRYEQHELSSADY